MKINGEEVDVDEIQESLRITALDAESSILEYMSLPPNQYRIEVNFYYMGKNEDEDMYIDYWQGYSMLKRPKD